MRKTVSLLALTGLLVACDKEESTNVFPDPPVVNTVVGKFSISFDSSAFRVDSMRSYYLNPVGNLDSMLTIGKYAWESPGRRYDRADTGYAAVRVFGVRLRSGAAIPEMRFSENITPMHLTSNTGNRVTDAGIPYFFSEGGFRF